MSISTSIPACISNYDFYDDLEFEYTYQLLIQSSTTKQKETSSKFWLLDIDGNDIILSKYEVYFDKDEQGNRHYFRMIDDSPLFQDLESIVNYKNKNKKN